MWYYTKYTMLQLHNRSVKTWKVFPELNTIFTQIPFSFLIYHLNNGSCLISTHKCKHIPHRYFPGNWSLWSRGVLYTVSSYILVTTVYAGVCIWQSKPEKINIQIDSALQALWTPKFKTVFFKLQLFYTIQENPNSNP